MLLRAMLLLGLLLVPLCPAPAAAIVVTCPNGFQNCDPYTGTCYTAWTASLAGQVQANCATNPAACWQQSLTAPPTCDDPTPPPVNPNALRVCPFGADCGVGFPPHPIDQYAPGVRAQPGHIIYSYLGTAPVPLPPCCDPPTLDVSVALDDYLGTLINGPGAPDGQGGFWPHFSQWTRLIPLSVATFEPAPSCGWTIAPTSPVQPCVLPQSAMLAAMKNDSPTQWTGLKNYYERLNKRIDVKRWALTNGLYGSPTSKRYASQVARLVWFLDLASLIIQLVADPPNPNYQSLPGPGVYPPLTPLTSDATLTQAQINAIQAWLAALRATVITGRQLTETIDNLAGAILAAEAGTPGAAAWVRRLALHADTTLATLVTKGLAEIATRAAVVSAGPNVSQPAACATPTDAANFLKQAVLGGSTLYQGHLTYQEHLGSCGEAVLDPAWMTSDSAADTALWNSFSTFSFAEWLCDHAHYCGTDTIGLWRPSTNTFYLRNSNTPGPADITIAGIGGAGDLPLIGDWDGNGTKTFGIFRPSTATFYLWNTNAYGTPDITITGIGGVGDIPLVGDWDGNGTTTFGVYRPSAQTFYLWNANTYGPPHVTIAAIGAAGDTPLVGDWDGNGTTTFGLYRPSSNTYYLWNANAYGPPSLSIAGIGAPGDLPVMGDWDGNGTVTLGLYRPSNATFYLWNQNVYGPPNITVPNFGAPGDQPLGGNWDGQ